LLIASFDNLWTQNITRYNTFSYSVNEGLLQTTIREIEIDKNNFCWISFPNGIQKFDGSVFTNVPVQPGLPDDKMVSFFRCANGDLLISHSQGISSYDIDRDKFTQVFGQSSGLHLPVFFIGEDENNIYFYDENSIITGISSNTYKTTSKNKTGFPSYSISSLNRPKFSDNCINHKTALMIGGKLYLWDLQEGKPVASSPEIPKATPHFLYLLSADEVIFISYDTNNALQCWNFKTNTHRVIPVKGKDNSPIGRCHFLPWQNKWLLVLTDHMYQTDSLSFELKSEMVDFQNQPISDNFGIASVKQDNFGNLYVQTVNGGIKKIISNNYPVKYFGKSVVKNNNILAVLPDKENNRVLTGGNEGLLIFDTLQRLIKEIKTLPGRNGSNLINGIIKSADGSYYIFCNGEKRVWLLDKNLTTLRPLTVYSHLPADKSEISYFGNLLYRDDKGAIMQTQDMIYRINFNTKNITEQSFSNEYIMGGLIYGNMILSHGNDELLFLDRETTEIRKKIPFKNTGGVRCFTKDKNGNIFIGSNKGIFKTDTTGRVLQQWNKQTGLPDECIYALVFDKDGSLWCSSNKGIFRLSSDNNILQLTKADGLQENEFNTNVMAVAKDGELFFGGVNGVSSFYPAAISNYKEKVNLFITGIKVNNEDIYSDTAVWNIRSINLSYRQNSLSFDFIAMGNQNPSQYTYQYKMKGLEKEWTQAKSIESIRYLLQPGTYTFQVYASRQFEPNAVPLKELLIIIKPPFWKTWWFGSFAIVSLLVFLFFLVNRRNKLKYEKKLQLLENERQIKLERERISKDLHDNLGVYANAVLYNTELLEKETEQDKRVELIHELRFASKDIITSLRETVWALKKENYTAEECLVRIRNFIQPLTRYYQQIKFQVEGDAPDNLSFHYTKALNIVRIVQEAVANSIKHSGTSIISIHSTIHTGDNRWEIRISDIGKGFVYNPQVEPSNSNGLINMRQRAAASGFRYSLVSDENKGTTITIIM